MLARVDMRQRRLDLAPQIVQTRSSRRSSDRHEPTAPKRIWLARAEISGAIRFHNQPDISLIARLYQQVRLSHSIIVPTEISKRTQRMKFEVRVALTLAAMAMFLYTLGAPFEHGG